MFRARKSFFLSAADKRGFSLIEVMIAGAISAGAVMIGVQSFQSSSRKSKEIQIKEALIPIDGDIKHVGGAVVSQFLSTLRNYNSQHGIGNLCQLNTDVPFTATTGYIGPSGLKFVLLDKSQMSSSGNVSVLPNYQPSNPSYQAAKSRCESTDTIYENANPPLSDIASKKSIYWCMGTSQASDSAPAFGKMNGMIEFLFTPLNVRTGLQLTCTEYMSQKFADPDEVVGLLYYSVYWNEGESNNVNHGFYVLSRNNASLTAAPAPTPVPEPPPSGGDGGD